MLGPLGSGVVSIELSPLGSIDTNNLMSITYFDQQTACRATVRWSKYTTVTIYLQALSTHVLLWAHSKHYAISSSVLIASTQTLVKIYDTYPFVATNLQQNRVFRSYPGCKRCSKKKCSKEKLCAHTL